MNRIFPSQTLSKMTKVSVGCIRLISVEHEADTLSRMVLIEDRTGKCDKNLTPELTHKSF